MKRTLIKKVKQQRIRKNPFNMEISSETSFEPVRLSSSISVPPSCLKTLSHKIDNLVEITHLSKNIRIDETHLLLMNRYSLYHRDRSVTRRLRHLIHNRSPHVKEYVQSARMDQCGLRTLDISPELINLWRRQGYTHIHFVAVRLCLTLHGRKRIAATARVALLNTIYTKYQNALIVIGV